MKYRKLDSLGDYTFGQNGNNFHKDNPEAVSQSVSTRLKLMQGEWFLDTSEGTPYNSRIFGAGKLSSYDSAIQEVILNTPGVRRIVNYTSGVDPQTRRAVINCTIDTIYGQVTTLTSL